ncbi:hypothetical protein MARCHEWKA_02970 [Brevundimonas phage vB_BpoS-Marchewka]|uniref:Uncharacterized protein n=1 Tax=Brevundimonas phage vB_BpoS-Marchewka TaxID=2948604 RepID=A0A9E7N2S7_9CAUD|nr:hypothetical protein MARCHEWKA_02970 [Brevundimonas phage vB_BpoS-Marchewka]UTC29256.1 hypothetical protein BAMBUS_01740 [Brevundimonas phage vB_BpoS-Bambus]
MIRTDYRRIGKRAFYDAVRRYEMRHGGLAFENPVPGLPPRVDWRHNGDLIGYVIKATSSRDDDVYWIDRRLTS